MVEAQEQCRYQTRMGIGGANPHLSSIEDQINGGEGAWMALVLIRQSGLLFLYSGARALSHQGESNGWQDLHS